MPKPILVGEAPSLQGDGRPFTGPSGGRLQSLLGLKSYDELTDALDMLNIFEKVSQPAWDRFDRKFARQRAIHLLTKWHDHDPEDLLDVILCGRKVMAAFGVEHLDWFGFHSRGGVVLWAFPHPSGLSHFWNAPDDVLRASRFLRARVLASCAHHPRAGISLDQSVSEALLNRIP